MILSSPLEFAALLPAEGRLLGLDVGDKTIGLALSDATRAIASPLLIIDRGKFSKDVEQLKAVMEKHGIAGLVVGYPVNMDGSLGPRAQSTRTFCSNLQKHSDLPILLKDERMSTMAVERTMLEADLSRKRREQLVDKLAAAYILQAALDAIKGLGIGD